MCPTLPEQDKRSALVGAAASMLYMRGYEGTTLALVAEAAKVPIGNVYYYFKSKDALTDAVLEARASELTALFASLETKLADATSRVRSFVAVFAEAADHVALYGCPYGGLSHELSKRSGALGERSSLLFDLQIAWLTTQFITAGAHPEAAIDRARNLVSAIQGACILSASMRDPDSFRKRLKDLGQDINTNV
jgi:TetR/AcrR family transcriptional regulator, transcriptional repressor for nem operon